SIRVFDERHRFAGIDAAKRAPAVVIHIGVLAPAGTSDQCGCLRRAVHKLPLRDRRTNNGARVDLASSLCVERLSRGHRFLSDIGAKVTSAYRASTKLPEGRRTKMRERSRGSYFISNLPLQRPTSAVSAEDQ